MPVDELGRQDEGLAEVLGRQFEPDLVVLLPGRDRAVDLLRVLDDHGKGRRAARRRRRHVAAPAPPRGAAPPPARPAPRGAAAAPAAGRTAGLRRVAHRPASQRRGRNRTRRIGGRLSARSTVWSPAALVQAGSALSGIDARALARGAAMREPAPGRARSTRRWPPRSTASRRCGWPPRPPAAGRQTGRGPTIAASSRRWWTASARSAPGARASENSVAGIRPPTHGEHQHREVAQRRRQGHAVDGRKGQPRRPGPWRRSRCSAAASAARRRAAAGPTPGCRAC